MVEIILGNDIVLESQTKEEQAMEYLDTFLSFYHNQIHQEFEESQKEKNMEGIKKYFDLTNTLSAYGVILLSRFQNHEGYTEKWKLSIKFPKYE
jgi:hypothetical protein